MLIVYSTIVHTLRNIQILRVVLFDVETHVKFECDLSVLYIWMIFDELCMPSTIFRLHVIQDLNPIVVIYLTLIGIFTSGCVRCSTFFLSCSFLLRNAIILIAIDMANFKHFHISVIDSSVSTNKLKSRFNILFFAGVRICLITWNDLYPVV